MNVAITGGAGFIGRNLSSYLHNKGWGVHIFDNFERSGKMLPTYSYHPMDLRYAENLDLEFKNMDLVIHLAAKVGSFSYYEENALEVLCSNLSIDANVINAADKAGVKKFIYAGSAHVYSDTQSLIKEDSPTDPGLSYGYAKLVGEKLLAHSSMRSAIMRLIGIYGPGQDYNIDNGSFIPVMCFKSLSYPENGYKLRTDGSETRTYCYIEDLLECVETTINLLNTKKSIGPLNIGSGEEYSMKEIASKIDPMIPLEVSTDVEPVVKRQVCDCSEAERVLGWKATTSLEVGLKKVYDDIEARYA
tara:strand:+ start:106 stop:1014 length:909 start_codon:yes stop_codon:yes gene_type:complete